MLDLGDIGSFYKHIIKAPEKFVKHQPELLQSLIALRKARKFLFIVTNHHLPFTDLVMKQTLGDDWKDYFNLILCDCRKPLF